MPKSWPINALFQMPKFGIMLYLVPNLAQCISFVKFNIALKNVFYVKISNFDIGTQIWYYIGDALNQTKKKFCSTP